MVAQEYQGAKWAGERHGGEREHKGVAGDHPVGERGEEGGLSVRPVGTFDKSYCSNSHYPPGV